MTKPSRTLPSPPAHVHFVGVGGIGMSGLARILRTWGYRVTGSDSFQSDQTDLLAEEGVAITIGHSAVAEAASAALVVATAAVRETNPELHAAHAAGVPVIKRAELLGMLANVRTCIAVAGSHGKSTTSGMMVTALRALGRDPNYAVGAVVASTGTNAAPGHDDVMVVEADEYDYSFLWLKPTFGIITNIDYDHPDLFLDQGAYDRAFVRFAQGFPDCSLLAINGDDPGVRRVVASLRGSKARVVTYGRERGNDWILDGTTVRSPAGISANLELKVPGAHNLSNAMAVLIVLDGLGIPLVDAAPAVNSFSGVGRRFDIKGEVDGIAVIDDYAHHPQEIRATIAASRERYPGRRLVAAFQPHTYSRTRMLVDEFADALRVADLAVVLDIYASRETDSLGVSSADILDRMKVNAVAGGRPADAIDRLAALVQPGDVVLTMGAGDVTLVGPGLLDALREHAR